MIVHMSESAVKVAPDIENRVDWLSYIHNLRSREIRITFGRCSPNTFEEGLELGAGDGFQSTLLQKYISRLICTDLNSDRLIKNDIDKIQYLTCDAEEVDKYFSEKRFDIIFSSNLFEHLPNPDKCLKGIHKILKEQGVIIHIMPNPFWKLCQIIMFYPNLLSTMHRHMKVAGGMRGFLEQIHKKIFDIKAGKNNKAKVERNMGNNPKSTRRKYGYLRTMLWLTPHGAYNSNIEELCRFRKSRWIKEINSAGFRTLKVLKGPVSSGYGFGFDRLRGILERIGITSEYIYVAEKKDTPCQYKKYF